MKNYAVVHNNIGTVYSGKSRAAALAAFEESIELSKAKGGRGSGEEVTLFKDGEIEQEYAPPVLTSYHRHEVGHTASIVVDMWERHIETHPYVVASDALSKKAEHIGMLIHAFYQHTMLDKEVALNDESYPEDNPYPGDADADDDSTIALVEKLMVKEMPLSPAEFMRTYDEQARVVSKKLGELFKGEEQ